MPMDKQDYEMVRAVRDAVRSGDEVNAKLLRQLVQQQEKSDAAMVAAFNSIAKAVQTLSAEISGLRADLAPQLDKPKLVAPAAKKQAKS
ncbi:MAG: hypothetical protein PSY14_13450 [bacterium]|nr:hypothetical protein [bacterium]